MCKDTDSVTARHIAYRSNNPRIRFEGLWFEEIGRLRSVPIAISSDYKPSMSLFRSAAFRNSLGSLHWTAINGYRSEHQPFGLVKDFMLPLAWITNLLVRNRIPLGNNLNADSRRAISPTNRVFPQAWILDVFLTTASPTTGKR